MRYRLMATYRGAPYEAGIGPTGADVVLFAACPPPEELGFEPATGHWRKQLPIQEVEAVWESRPTGMFRGERCIILDDLGDRLHLGYLGQDGYLAAQLGYWQVDRGVFELVTARDEVTDIVEERADYPRLPGRPAPGRDLQPAPAAPVSGPAPATCPPAGFSDSAPGADPSGSLPAGFSPAGLNDRSGVALPPAAERRLPLEAAAMEAAARHRAAAERDSRAARPAPASPAPRRRRSAQPVATQCIFAELAALAAIPESAYAIGAAVDGALCLVPTPAGYEVFSAAGGLRRDVRVFGDEESAYFYLFGVLAAEAVRTGVLAPKDGPAAPPAALS
ncbi:MAG: hypothetical protein ACLP70_12145 [Streptosporangiaceae bacterium]|jgi:hypothetical protein